MTGTLTFVIIPKPTKTPEHPIKAIEASFSEDEEEGRGDQVVRAFDLIISLLLLILYFLMIDTYFGKLIFWPNINIIYNLVLQNVNVFSFEDERKYV